MMEGEYNGLFPFSLDRVKFESLGFGIVRNETTVSTTDELDDL